MTADNTEPSTDNGENAKDASAKGRSTFSGKDMVWFFAGAAAVYIVMTVFVFQVFFIPSESMQPALETSDRVLVSKFAYGYSRHSVPIVGKFLPQGQGGRLLTWLPFVRAQPERGDVVVFNNPRANRHLIKRVIGLPGDRLQVIDERLYINGEIVPRELLETYDYRSEPSEGPPCILRVDIYAEELPGGTRHPVLERREGLTCRLKVGLDNTGEYLVPPGHFFVMGDNRDGSGDSRAGFSQTDPRNFGYVPMEWLVGRAETVLFTFKSCDNEPGLQCPFGRVWRPL